MDYAFYQEYWWLLVSLLGAILVFLFFVQGGQSLLYTIGKTEDERSLLVNSIGKKWEFTFTTLVTFGGAFFASFPLFYSTSFGGAYWPWMIILICFVLQAVSYEFRKKEGNILGHKTYEAFLLFNGFVGLLLFGTAVGTFFTGSEFIVNKENIYQPMMPVISQWQNPLHGLEAAFNVRNLLLGFSIFFLARVLGSLYFISNIHNPDINKRSRKQVLINAIFFLVCFLTFFIWTLASKGFAVKPETGEVYMQNAKYLHNFIEMPIIGIAMLLGVVSLLYGIGIGIFCPKSAKGIWFAGVGTVLAVLSLLLILGYNNTAFYPSVTDLQSSLTIRNSSSSYFTLKVMSVVSLCIPFVLAYIFYAWRMMDKKQIDMKDLESKQNPQY
ncbi:MAG: cytochrome oxidase assembly protein [Bacteroidetes bacterium]|jgi:cytochrome bd ubiquinol oxidase subunit II|nr:cytochrome oxidase assembly protein [Bacteroidota bacterium]